MKNSIIIKLFSFLFLIVMFFVIDNYAYYYGNNNFSCFKIKLPNGFYISVMCNNFILCDKEKMTIIAPNYCFPINIEHKNCTKIKRITKYGNRDDIFYCVVENIDSKFIYIEFHPKYKYPLDFKFIKNPKEIININKFINIELDNIPILFKYWKLISLIYFFIIIILLIKILSSMKKLLASKH